MSCIIRSLAAILICFLCCVTVSAQDRDSTAFASAQWNWTDLGRGAVVGSSQIQLFDSMQSISILKYPAHRFHTSFYSAAGPDASSTDSLGIRSGAIFAMNGSYFDVRTRESATYFSENGILLSTTAESELTRSNGILAIKRRNGRRLEIQYYDPSLAETYLSDYWSVLAAGPVLLIDGEQGELDPQSAFNTYRHPRSFFGLDSSGYAYLIVVDGRFKGEAAGASIYELIRIARWLGITDAINFDGGGSSALWTLRTGIVSHPSDNRRFDHEGARRIPNIISVH